MSAARALQIALGALWLVDGLFQLQPHMFTSQFVTQVLEPSGQGQAPWISWLVGTNAHLVATNVAAWNAVFASAQLLIGAGLLLRTTVKPALAASIAWALGVWVFGEGFGMVMTGHASPLTGAPGAALLYAVIALIAWPSGHRGRHRASSGSPRMNGWPESAATNGFLGDLGTRIAWTSLWLLSAVLWLLPFNTAPGSIGRQVSTIAAGEPGWLSGLLTSTGHLLASGGGGEAVMFALVSVVIGIGPLCARRATPYLIAGAALSIAYWVFGQAFGGILTGPISGTATDPNEGPLMVLLALTLVPARMGVLRYNRSPLSGYSVPAREKAAAH